MSNYLPTAATWGKPTDPAEIGGMSDLKVIFNNLTLRIKEKYLPSFGYTSNYTESLFPVSTQIDPNTNLTTTAYQTRFNDIVYYNPGVSGLLDTPIVTPSGNLAYVDYPNGLIYFSGAQNNQINVTYSYYSVYVQQGWPDWGFDQRTLETLRLPAVHVDFARKETESYLIGGTRKETKYFVINVTAESDAQKEDIVEALVDQLRLPFNMLEDYSLSQFPLLFTGDKNPNYNRMSYIRKLRLTKKVTHKNYRRQELPEKLRHQSIISMIIYTV